ncbi:MAG: 5'-nucleotidase C-terminal domain-containing protein [Pyrinomonadaceae bacterium]
MFEIQGKTRTFTLVCALFILLFHFSGQAQQRAIQPCPDQVKSHAPAIAETKVPQVTETLIDSTIGNDPAVSKLLEKYSERVHALATVIGTVDGEFNKSGIGGGSLGNLVTDAMRLESRQHGKPAVLALTNTGGLRKSAITAGELHASEIFELLPFENSLVTIDLTGAQLTAVLQVVTSARDAQSGAGVQFKWNETKPEFLNAVLRDDDGVEHEIDPKATYTIVTIDYLLNVGRTSYSILREGKNSTPMGVTLRDVVINYIKSESAAKRSIKPRLDDRFKQIGPGRVSTTTIPND